MLKIKNIPLKILIPISILFTILLASTLYLIYNPNAQRIPIQSSKPTQEEESNIKIPSTEEIILSKMTPEQKVGQLFIFGFDGTSLSQTSRNFLHDHYIGGVLLLGKNISNEKQLQNLTKQIQETNDIPLFISIDQEGGTVSRIQWNKTLTKPQSEINTPEQAYTNAKSRGEMLKGYGVNMNLAPVAEYITDSSSFMYNRVYRGTRQEVANKATSATQGYTEADIISVLKHFPGHSNTSPDSHYYLPTVNIKESQWEEYVKPFSQILEKDIVDAIMIGHVKYPNIDSNPSTISKEIINNRLVKELSFSGLIISDDMEMDALEDLGSNKSIAKNAFLAGNDILIYSKYTNENPTLQKEIYDYILKEVKNGNMNIDSKVEKILRIKIKYQILSPSDF